MTPMMKSQGLNQSFCLDPTVGIPISDFADHFVRTLTPLNSSLISTPLHRSMTPPLLRSHSCNSLGQIGDSVRKQSSGLFPPSNFVKGNPSGERRHTEGAAREIESRVISSRIIDEKILVNLPGDFESRKEV